MTVWLLWCIGTGVGGGVIVLLGALWLRGLRLGEHRHKYQEQTTGPAGAMFNALFLAAFALSLVIAWQAYDHAKDDVAAESAALVSVYDDVPELPNSTMLRGEIRNYANVVLNQEWPLLPSGGSVPEAGRQLARMSNQILGLPSDEDAVQATRQETVKELDAVGAARDQRLRDASTSLPAGLLACLVITATVALGHGLLAGLPHTASSLIPLVAEAALVAGAVCIVFLIRSPFHGALAIGPDQIRLAIAHFAARE